MHAYNNYYKQIFYFSLEYIKMKKKKKKILTIKKSKTLNFTKIKKYLM